MTDDRLDELISLAALGELSPDERAELEEAARADATVAAEVDEALAAAAALQGVDAPAPPPALRASVLASIATTPQEARVEATTVTAAEPVGAPIPLDRRRARRRRLAPFVAAAAAAVVMIVGAVVVMSGDNRGVDQVDAVIDSFDASTAILTGEFELLVTYSPSAGAVVIEGEQLPVLGESETYQLWLVDDAGATSVGVFSPGSDGAVTVRFDDIDPTGFTLGVTEEPAGGSATPTLPILTST